MTTGSVIVLNGPSSAGKSTLAVALQRRFAADGECWFVYGMDDYFAKLPLDWVTAGNHVGAHADDGVVLEVVDGVFRMRMGPIGRQVLAAWRGAVGSAARAGLNVIADDVLLTDEEWQGWQAELDGLDAHWVRVQIDLDVLEAREQARGNRMPGQARSQYEVAYRHATYDAEVDTGTSTPTPRPPRCTPGGGRGCADRRHPARSRCLHGLDGPIMMPANKNSSQEMERRRAASSEDRGGTMVTAQRSVSVRILVVVAVVSMLAVACGSSGGDSKSSAGGSTTTTVPCPGDPIKLTSILSLSGPLVVGSATQGTQDGTEVAAEGGQRHLPARPSARDRHLRRQVVAERRDEVRS